MKTFSFRALLVLSFLGLARATSAESEPRTLPAVWHWPLYSNFGVRGDKSGEGWFRAPRGPYRKHNGLDLLAPLDSSVFALCDGKAVYGSMEPYGNWVSVVCQLPEALVGREQIFVSILYAHLQPMQGPITHFVDVSAGEFVGRVGKTGNASGPLVAPHLHIEIIAHDSLDKAMGESYPIIDKMMAGPASIEAQMYVEGMLKMRCLGDHDLRRSDNVIRHERRFDPYLLLACLADQPPTEQAPPPLDLAERPLSLAYESFRVDVDNRHHALLLSP